MADSVTIDFETKSVADLRQTGVYRYAEDPSTGIWVLGYRFDRGAVQIGHPWDPAPRELLDHVSLGRRVVAHNSGFERTIWNTVLLRDNPSWPRLTIAQQDDTMARALAVHLPADLDTLAIVLGLATKKDREGHNLMMRMSRPRKIHAADSTAAMCEINGLQWTHLPDGRVAEWWAEQDKIARQDAYCAQDVLVEDDADAKLPALSPEERSLWERDQAINDRGVMLDVATIERCVAVRDVAKARADARMEALTGGSVRKVSEALRIVEWLKARGIPCDSIAKGEHADLRGMAELLGDDEAVEAIDLRGEASKTSTAKFDKMLATVCADGRARGLFSYHRALTGRWGGSNVQPQNLPRVDEERELPHVLAAIEAMRLFA